MRRRDFLKAAAAAFVIPGQALAQSGHDLALVNGRIMTMDAAHPGAEAALVRNGRIVMVGSNAEIDREAGGVARFDAEGRVVVPGFVDTHVHFELTCLAREYQVACHTPPHRALREIFETLRSSVAGTPKDRWIVGRSSFSLRGKVEEGRLATRHELDAITTDHPLALFSGLHVAMLNTRALHELGLWDRAENPPRGVYIDVEPSGTPSGLATEVWDLLPTYSVDEVILALRNHAEDVFVSKGTTTIGNIPYSANDLRADQALQARGELPVRLRAYHHVPRTVSLTSLLDAGLVSGMGDSMFRFGGIKIFIDGIGYDALGNVLDDSKRTQSELNEFVSGAHAAGIQLIMHALTTKGMLMAADAVEEAMRRDGRPHRHRIEHAGGLLERPEEFQRLASLGILPVVTPHFWQREGNAVPRFKTMIERGLMPVMVTDTTGTVPGSSAPLRNMAASMVEARHGGAAPNAAEKLTFEQALRMNTEWAAYSIFEDHEKGTITPGKLADFAILSEDPETLSDPDLFDMGVDATILGGQVVYQS
ncbi:MAG TPA: amidohydrolase family protein [Acidobacteriota bacterium]|nr:amidohydrolase family protein [Acidobacteriota bacterium]